jgi:inorganic triphosphatase YgiF
LISDQRISQSLRQSGAWSRLRPCFRTDFERTAWLVRYRDSTFELAWDSGRVIAGQKNEPINEIELELKTGSAQDLFAAAQALLDTVPFRIGRLTKAERGFALLQGEKPSAVRALPARLLAGESIATGFEKIVQSCLDHMAANEAAILDSIDPEAIHQIRVALRRFRAILGPFRQFIDDGVHAAWAIDLRWAQRQFGPARDLDVFINDTARPMLVHLEEERGVIQLLALAQAARERARKTAILAIHNPRYAEMQLQILIAINDGRWRHGERAADLSAPLRPFADGILQERHKKVRRYGKHWRTLSDGDLHRLRIMVKKLRYAVGFFEPLYRGKRCNAYVAAVGKLQDSLGAVNDAVVGRQLLREFAGSLKNESGEPVAAIENLERALGLVAGWQARGIEAERQSFEGLWDEFAGARRFWTKKQN